MELPSLSVVQFTRAGADAVELGLQTGTRVAAVPADWPASLLDLLADWAHWAPRLRAVDAQALPEVPDAVLRAPLLYPHKLICAGANYYDHAREMGTAPPDPGAEPFFFLKPPTTTVIGTGAAVRLPDIAEANVDWEVELGVVVADRCRDVAVADAAAHVAGYVVANDISARGLFTRPAAVFPAFAHDWLAHKGLDTFCPLGPGFVPSWLVPDPQDLRLTLTRNGVLEQDSSTSQMVVGVAGLLAAASRLMTLEPGDVILTGTPAGVGMPRGVFLAAGDVLVAEVAGIGSLTNPVVAS